MKKLMVLLAVCIFTITAAIPALGAESGQGKPGVTPPLTSPGIKQTMPIPDLIVESIKRQTVKVENASNGKWVTYQHVINIKNQGTGPAGPFKVCFEWEKGGTLWEAEPPKMIDFLGQKSTKIIYTKLKREFHNFLYFYSTFRVTVDCEKKVRESNEDNNVKELPGL